MNPYPKIKNIYKRDPKTHKLILGEFSAQEFEYLQEILWVFTEKIDGTNVRIMVTDGEIDIRGRSDKDQIPPFLKDTIQKIFPSPEPLLQVFGSKPFALYGEGYGIGIQKNGHKYNPNGNSFALFDIYVENNWLNREDVEEIANKIGVNCVPIRSVDHLVWGVKLIREGCDSLWGDFPAEGLVARPAIELLTRHGERIITKIKRKDFLV